LRGAIAVVASGAVLAAILAAAAAAYFGGRYLSRQRLLHGRESMAVMRVLEGLPQDLDRQKAQDILQKLGTCYGVPAGALRLEDKMTLLAALDSWLLGKGQEEFEAWLQAEGVNAPLENVATIQDLIVAVLNRAKTA
jgi:hypothetical protein